MNNELLAVIEYFERERGLERPVIVECVRQALLSAAKRIVYDDEDLRVEIDPKTYDIAIYANVEVTDDIEDPMMEISVTEARRIKPDVEEGDFVEKKIGTEILGRIGAQKFRQAILHHIKQAEKEHVFEEFKDVTGDIVSGIVRGFERSDVLLDIGRAEARMPSRERVRSEEYQVGERIRAYVLSVEKEATGTDIIVSRSHPDFVKRLFELEVSEIADHTVEIRAIAREPGYRTKIAVFSNDEKVDPVGACVGMRGMRVKNIVRELSGEKIDIVRWHDDIKMFVTNALGPAKLNRLTIDEATRTIKVEVDSDQLSLAIGKNGQNARLTAKLSGWKIDIQKDEADLGFEEKIELAIKRLAAVEGIGEELATKLVNGGFLTIEGIQAAELEDLTALDEIDEDTAQQVKEAAGAVSQ